MSKLSSNWKRLSKTITNSDASVTSEKSSVRKPTPNKKNGAVSKNLQKVLKSNPTKRIILSKSQPATRKENTTTKKDIVPTPQVHVEGTEQVRMDALELTLWNNENEIAESDIIRESRIVTVRVKDRKKGPGKYLAMDCEFVGVGDGKESALARVSVVNFYGTMIYDVFVKPKEKVTDWRTWVSGVSQRDMTNAVSFEQAQTEVAKLLKDKILVGHSVHNDLESLFLSHPKMMIRDTAKFPLYKELSGGKPPGLKKLTAHFLKLVIQQGAHSSVDDARATMLLFRLNRKDFENQPSLKFHVKK